MELVPVATVTDAGEANLVRGVLEQAGIDAQVSGTGTEDVFITPTTNPFHILVPEDEADQARDVLAQYDTTPEDAEDDE
jgi:hypothetical protein